MRAFSGCHQRKLLEQTCASDLTPSLQLAQLEHVNSGCVWQLLQSLCSLAIQRWERYSASKNGPLVLTCGRENSKELSNSWCAGISASKPKQASILLADPSCKCCCISASAKRHSPMLSRCHSSFTKKLFQKNDDATLISFGLCTVVVQCRTTFRDTGPGFVENGKRLLQAKNAKQDSKRCS